VEPAVTAAVRAETLLRHVLGLRIAGPRVGPHDGRLRAAGVGILDRAAQCGERKTALDPALVGREKALDVELGVGPELDGTQSLSEALADLSKVNTVLTAITGFLGIVGKVVSLLDLG
jgi:hypothetical protein